MNDERTDLAELFAHYLKGTLVDDANMAAWERLSKSNDPTIRNGCQILGEQVDDTLFDVQLLDKPEWDYLERVRLALLGNASIVKRNKFRFGWRNALYGLGFFAFVLLAIQFGLGYHLLPATAFLGLVIFGVSNFFPEPTSRLPYQSIISPFTSFSNLKHAHTNATSFEKIRYNRSERKRASPVLDCVCAVIALIAMAALSPLFLLVLAFPDTEPEFQAGA